MKTRYAWVSALVFLILSLGSARQSFGMSSAPTVDAWYGQNREMLNTMLELNGKESPEYNSAHKPVAVFDWDNTSVKNDVGDATFFFMVNHNYLRHPGDWAKSSPFLTSEAVAALSETCPGKKGDRIHTTRNESCAALMVSIYNDGVLSDGKTAAFNNANPDTMDPACVWTVQLMSGYSIRQMHSIAKRAIRFNLKNPIGATQKVGGQEFPAYVRIYEEQKNLIRMMKEKGFEVWVATASAQAIVEMIAPQIGVDASHVIGIRPILDAHQKITDSFEGCGDFKAGNKDIITYRLGKRCWINKIIFGITDAKAQMQTRNATVFAAGDSDTDVFFVRDAKYHLAINRNKSELMCNAYQNADGHWMINPMFIDPKPMDTAGYDCSAFGIPNQVDAVF